jgi:ribonuclease H2 subunit C
MNVTDKQVSQPAKRRQDEDEDEDAEAEREDQDVEVTIAEQIGEFDEIMIWGHGGDVDSAQDAYVKGMNEWVGWAESMHGDAEEEEEEGERGKKGQ